jgi:branched-chain amino acid transport system substrate-binding protein
MAANSDSRRMTRRQFLRRTALAGGAFGVSSLLAACGGAAAPATGGGTAAPAATGGTPLKIGLLLPTSDIYAALGASITEGMKMYFESVGNKAGGRDIQIIAEDEGTKPDVAAQKARKLVEQDQVDLVAGIVSSGVAAAVRDYFNDNKKFLILANAGANALTRAAKSPYIFRASFSNWQPNWVMGKWVAENVGKKAFVSVPDYAAGNETVSAFRNSFEAAGGQVVKVQKTPFPNMGDPAPFLAEIKAAAPELVYSFYSGAAATTFVKAYADFGLSGSIPLTGSGFMVEQDVLPAVKDAAVGVRSSLFWARSLDNPENKKFVEDFGKRTIQGGNPGANVFAMQGYDAARLIVEALNSVGGDVGKADALIEALGKVSFPSPRGTFKMDANTHNVINHLYVREVKKDGDSYSNAVIADLGEAPDPGDDSKDTKA